MCLHPSSSLHCCLSCKSLSPMRYSHTTHLAIPPLCGGSLLLLLMARSNRNRSSYHLPITFSLSVAEGPRRRRGRVEREERRPLTRARCFFSGTFRHQAKKNLWCKRVESRVESPPTPTRVKKRVGERPTKWRQTSACWLLFVVGDALILILSSWSAHKCQLPIKAPSLSVRVTPYQMRSFCTPPQGVYERSVYV